MYISMSSSKINEMSNDAIIVEMIMNIHYS